MDISRKIEQLSSAENINTLNTNFKAELLAASLIEAGYDQNRMVLERRGVDSNGFIREIDIMRVKYPSSDPSASYFSIQTGRGGIYDTLPEGVFHCEMPCKGDKSKEQMLEEIAMHRNEEFYARKFFALYEMEIDKLRIQYQLKEILFDKKTIYRDFTNIFIRYWNIITEMDDHEALRFVMIVPYINKFRINECKIANTLSFILENDISIKRKNISRLSRVSCTVPISEMRLGINTILSGRENNETHILCSVSNLISQEVPDYLECGRKKIILDALFALFFDCDSHFHTSIMVAEDQRKCGLGGVNTYLGINTYLNTNES